MESQSVRHDSETEKQQKQIFRFICNNVLPFWGLYFNLVYCFLFCTKAFWKINIVKMTIIPKAIYRFNAIFSKLPIVFFTELEQKIQFVWKHKTSWICKEVLRKRNGAGVINFIVFRLHYKATVIKTVQYWDKNRNKDQWNKIECPEINSCTHGNIIFDKGCKNIQ